MIRANKIGRIILTIAILAVLLLSADFVLAQGGNATGNTFGLETASTFGLPNVTLVDFIGNLVKIFLGILGIIAVLLLIYAGLMWMTAGGDPNKIEKAKKTIYGAIIGLVIIFSSYAIASFVINSLKGITEGPGVCDYPPCGSCDSAGSVTYCGPDSCGVKYCMSNGVWGSCDLTACGIGYDNNQLSYIAGFSDPNLPHWTRHRALGWNFHGVVPVPLSTSTQVWGYTHDRFNAFGGLDLWQHNPSESYKNYFQAGVVNGLRAYYQFNSNANDTLVKNNGVSSGVAYASGTYNGLYKSVYGQAAVFNGSTSYIELPTSTLSNIKGTISLWVKHQDLLNSYDIGHIVYACGGPICDGGAGYGGEATIHLNVIDNNRYQVYAQSYEYDPASTSINAIATVSPTNVWRHVLVKYDFGSTNTSSTISLYVNGEEAASSTGTKISMPIFGHLQLGSPVSNTRYFNGSMDELKIYDRLLTDSEIVSLYNNEQASHQESVRGRMANVVKNVYAWWNTSASAGYSIGATSSVKIKVNGTSPFWSLPVEVIFRPAHCFNGIKDSNESGRDCGGDCGACPGQECSDATSTCIANNAECSYGVCDPVSCLCAGPPEIDYISPARDLFNPTTTIGDLESYGDDIANGAIGNYITAWGRSFGRATGTASFENILSSSSTLASVAPCSNTWSNNQIVLEVPSGLDIVNVYDDSSTTSSTANYYVKVFNNTTGLSSEGKYFQVNRIDRPGICSADPTSGVHPSTTDIFGNKFPTSSPQYIIWYFRSFNASSSQWINNNVTSSGSAWTAGSVTDVIPDYVGHASNTTAFRIFNGLQYSNYFKFIISAGGIGDPCGYDALQCGYDDTTCVSGLNCDKDSCTCQPATQVCTPNTVSTTCKFIGACEARSVCKPDGTAWSVCEQKDPACIAYGLTPPASQAMYAWGFTNIGGGEGMSCGLDAWNECDISGCQKGLVCGNVSGKATTSSDWIEVYNFNTSLINYSVDDIRIEVSDKKSDGNYSSPKIYNSATNGYIDPGGNSTFSSDSQLTYARMVGLKLPSSGAKIQVFYQGVLQDELIYDSDLYPSFYAPKSIGRTVDGLDTNSSTDFIVYKSSTPWNLNNPAVAHASSSHLVINEISVGVDPCTCIKPCNVCKTGDKNPQCKFIGVCEAISICTEDGCGFSECTQKDQACKPYPTRPPATMSFYAWAFNTYRTDPSGMPCVIEDCSRNTDCRAGQKLPSPTPWYVESTTNPLYPEGWSEQVEGLKGQIANPKACSNAVVSARFNKPMKASTFTTGTSGTVKLLKASTTGDWEEATIGTIDVTTDDGKVLKVYPAGELDASSTYKVVLLSGIRGYDYSIMEPSYAQIDNIRCEEIENMFTSRNCLVSYKNLSNITTSTNNAAYCWNFQTRSTTDKCKEGCPECTPDPTKGYYYGNENQNDSDLDSQDNVCIMINPWQYDWRWIVNRPERESITNNDLFNFNTASGTWDVGADPAPGKIDPRQTSTALGETIYDNTSSPTRIFAQLLITGKQDYCEVVNDFTNPIVIEDEDCHKGTTQSPSPFKHNADDNSRNACINAAISARFSRNMVDRTIVSSTSSTTHPNIIIQTCTNIAHATSTVTSSCTNVTGNWGLKIFSYTHNDLTIEDMINAPASAEFEAEGFIVIPPAPLMKNQWYRVIINGGVGGVRGSKSSSSPDVPEGLLLTPSIGEDHFNTGEENRNDYYWIFKTGGEECPIDTINVSPFAKFMRYVGQNEKYSAFPQAANCNILNPERYVWDWRSLIELSDDDATKEFDVSGGTGIEFATICNEGDTNCPSYTNPFTWQTRVFGQQEAHLYIKARATGTRVGTRDWTYDKWGSGELQIGYPSLRIVDRTPDSSVCTNPFITMNFSGNVRSDTIHATGSYPNILLYKCTPTMPKDMIIKLGYSYKDENGYDRVIIWSADNRVFSYSNNPASKTYRSYVEITSEYRGNGSGKLPVDFIPKFGYSFLDQDTSRVHLWGEDGRIYLYNLSSSSANFKKWVDITSLVIGNTTGTISTSFIPKLGYQKFNYDATNTNAIVWGEQNSSTTFYIYNALSSAWTAYHISDMILSGQTLFSGFNLKFAYGYVSGTNVINHYWGEDNSIIKYDSNLSVYTSATAEVIGSGVNKLPPSFNPKVGYAFKDEDNVYRINLWQDKTNELYIYNASTYIWRTPGEDIYDCPASSLVGLNLAITYPSGVDIAGSTINPTYTRLIKASSTSLLLPGNRYRVVVMGGASGTIAQNGTMLGGLNFKMNPNTGGEACDPGVYPYRSGDPYDGYCNSSTCTFDASHSFCGTSLGTCSNTEIPWYATSLPPSFPADFKIKAGYGINSNQDWYLLYGKEGAGTHKVMLFKQGVLQDLTNNTFGAGTSQLPLDFEPVFVLTPSTAALYNFQIWGKDSSGQVRVFIKSISQDDWVWLDRTADYVSTTAGKFPPDTDVLVGYQFTNLWHENVYNVFAKRNGKLELYVSDQLDSGWTRHADNILGSQAEQLPASENFTPSVAYVLGNNFATGGGKVYLWGKDNNETQLFIYDIDARHWQRQPLLTIANNNNNPIASDFTPTAGFVAYVGNPMKEKVYLWGTQGGQNVAYIGLSECDDGCKPQGNTNYASCGNKIVEPGEDCDDGNVVNNDGCSASCLWEGSNNKWEAYCTDGFIDYGEECDFGSVASNTSNGCGSSICLWNSASSSCSQTGVGICAAGSRGCDSYCHNTGSQIDVPVCGNNKVESGEQCEDGNTANGDGCSSRCLFEGSKGGAVCGNGLIENGGPDSYSWTFVVRPDATYCELKLPEIGINHCPNGIWRVGLSQDIIAATTTIYRISNASSSGCVEIAQAPKSFWQKALAKIMTVIRRLLGFNTALATNYRCKVFEQAYNAAELSHMKKGNYKADISGLASGIESTSTYEIIGYTRPHGDYLINYIRNNNWALDTQYDVTVVARYDEGIVTSTNTTVITDKLCNVYRSEVEVWPRGESKRNDAFFCAGDECGRYSEDLYDDDMSAYWTKDKATSSFGYDLGYNGTTTPNGNYRDGNQHLYRAWAYGDAPGYNGDNLIKSTNAWAIYNIQEATTSIAAVTSTSVTIDQWVTAGGKGGLSLLLVTSTDANNRVATATVDIITYFCNNPWPDPKNFPYRDSANNCAVGSGTCINTNFWTYYCRDRGIEKTCVGGSKSGTACEQASRCPGGECRLYTADDLPAFSSTSAIVRGVQQENCGNLPDNFVPKVGFYWNTKTYLINSEGVVYSSTGTAGWTLESRAAIAMQGLPANFKPIIGYVYNGNVELWDAQGNYKVGNGSTWSDGTKTGLPANFRPYIGYGYSNTIKHLWDAPNRYYYYSAGPPAGWHQVTTSDLDLINFNPVAGYIENTVHNIVLWNNKEIRYSTDSGGHWDVIDEATIAAGYHIPKSFKSKLGYITGSGMTIWDGQIAYERVGSAYFSKVNYFEKTCDNRVKDFIWGRRSDNTNILDQQPTMTILGDQADMSIYTTTTQITAIDTINHIAWDMWGLYNTNYNINIPSDGLYYFNIETGNHTNIDEYINHPTPSIGQGNPACNQGNNLFHDIDVYQNSVTSSNYLARLHATATNPGNITSNIIGPYDLKAGQMTLILDWFNNCGYKPVGASEYLWDSNLRIYDIKLYSYSSDAIGIRVYGNNNHYSPLYWYQNKFNVIGSPQAMIVDNNQAVKDGRTVYVDAANVSTTGSTIFSNIYLMSYTQGADSDTINIYNQMVKNWYFNTNLMNPPGDLGTCYNGPADYYCLTDDNCGYNLSGGSYCDNAAKARVTRDNRRLADIQDINYQLMDYYNTKRCSNDLKRLCQSDVGCYGGGICASYWPNLKAGSYVTGRSFSVWPSWQSTLGNTIGSVLPVDPINSFYGCQPPYNEATCWDEISKTMACPQDAYAYYYKATGTNYYINIKSEYHSTWWKPVWEKVNLLRYNPFTYYNTSTMCLPN